MDKQKASVLDKLQLASNVLVTVSKNPSVDQLAAAIGLSVMLNKLEKHATAVFSGKIPSTIEFLKPEATLEKTTDSLRDFIIALDKAKADKLRYKVEDKMVKVFITPYHTSIGQNDLEFSQGEINVDTVVALGVMSKDDIDQAIMAHGRILHDASVLSINTVEGANIGTINWADPKASSLSEMLAGLCDELKNDAMDGQMATAFLTGIVAQTNRFSNDKTSATTMSISARLMAAGANQQLIATQLQQGNAIGPAPQAQPTPPPAPTFDGSLQVDHAPVVPAAPQPMLDAPMQGMMTSAPTEQPAGNGTLLDVDNPQLRQQQKVVQPLPPPQQQPMPPQPQMLPQPPMFAPQNQSRPPQFMQNQAPPMMQQAPRPPQAPMPQLMTKPPEPWAQYIGAPQASTAPPSMQLPPQPPPPPRMPAPRYGLMQPHAPGPIISVPGVGADPTNPIAALSDVALPPMEPRKEKVLQPPTPQPSPMPPPPTPVIPIPPAPKIEAPIPAPVSTPTPIIPPAPKVEVPPPAPQSPPAPMPIILPAPVAEASKPVAPELPASPPPIPPAVQPETAPVDELKKTLSDLERIVGPAPIIPPASNEPAGGAPEIPAEGSQPAPAPRPIIPPAKSPSVSSDTAPELPSDAAEKLETSPASPTPIIPPAPAAEAPKPESVAPPAPPEPPKPPVDPSTLEISHEDDGLARLTPISIDPVSGQITYENGQTAPGSPPDKNSPPPPVPPPMVPPLG